MDKAHPRRFGPDFVDAQREQYGHRQPEGRMLTYDLAVEDSYEPWRAWLDQQLAFLPEAEADAFAATLWLDQHFWPHNIELAAGAALRERGFTLEYERRWGTLTPDWTVTDPSGTPVALVEVFTHSPPNKTFGAMKSWHALVERVKEIPVRVVLTVSGHRDGPLKAPDPRTAKKITQDLRRGLMSPLHLIRFDSHGYTFRVMADPRTGRAMETPGMSATLVPPSQMARVVSAQPLVEGIKAKVSKYRSISQETSLPLIVAAGAHKFTGLKAKQLDALLNGTLTVTMQFDLGDTYIHDPLTMRPDRPPRWSMPPDLAGVLWVDNETFPAFTTQWRPNPQALLPAPAAFATTP